MNDETYSTVLYTKSCEIEIEDMSYDLLQCEVSYVEKDAKRGLIQNNKIGLNGNIDYHSNIIIPCCYDNLYPLDEDGQLVVCISKGKLGLLELTADTNSEYASVQSKCILSCEYDRVEPMFKKSNTLILYSGLEKRWFKPESGNISEAFDEIGPLNWQYAICRKGPARFLFDLFYEKCIYTIPADWYCEYICEKGSGDVFLLTRPENSAGAGHAQQLLLCEHQAEKITLSPLARSISINMTQGPIHPYLARVEMSFEETLTD